MSFIDTIAPANAGEDVNDMYARQEDFWGYIPNYAKVFSHRPEVLARWGRLLAEIRRPMDDRRFEVATLAAAHELGNTACALAHGHNLARMVGSEAVLRLARGEACDTLSDVEAEIARFSRKLARDAASVTASDVNRLKRLGLSDAEVFDVVVTVAGRAFFTKVLDGLGVLADSPFLKMEPGMLETLTVGRPVSREPVAHVTAQ